MLNGTIVNIQIVDPMLAAVVAFLKNKLNKKLSVMNDIEKNKKNIQINSGLL